VAGCERLPIPLPKRSVGTLSRARRSPADLAVGHWLFKRWWPEGGVIEPRGAHGGKGGKRRKFCRQHLAFRLAAGLNRGIDSRGHESEIKRHAALLFFWKCVRPAGSRSRLGAPSGVDRRHFGAPARPPRYAPDYCRSLWQSHSPGMCVRGSRRWCPPGPNAHEQRMKSITTVFTR